MAKRNGTYYLGRVIKVGVLDNEKLIQALQKPKPIYIRNNSWTFTDVQIKKVQNTEYVFGYLCKYKPDGEIDIVNPERGVSEKLKEPNLRIASSLFVYIPKYSGLAFLNVSNHIEPTVFSKRFSKIVEDTHGNFFVKCSIESITDLRSFSVKLNSLDGIYEIKSKVYPPNPLFGHLWKELKEYLVERNTNQLSINEISEDIPLKTKLPKYVEDIANSNMRYSENDSSIPIGDAAILMAADGYGKGEVKGTKGEHFVTINTSETIKNFSYPTDPEPDKLASKLLSMLEEININRDMRH